MTLQLLFPRLVEHQLLVLLLLGVMDGGYLRLTGTDTDRSPSVSPCDGGDSQRWRRVGTSPVSSQF